MMDATTIILDKYLSDIVEIDGKKVPAIIYTDAAGNKYIHAFKDRIALIAFSVFVTAFATFEKQFFTTNGEDDKDGRDD